MRPSAVFLDCYGTLVADDRPAIEAVVSATARRVGVDAARLDRDWSARVRELCAERSGPAFGTQHDLEIEAMGDAVRAQGAVPGAGPLGELIRPLFRYWRSAAPFPDAVALLEGWQGCPLLIVSNIDRADLDQVLPTLPPVAAVVTSEDTRGYKPDPAVFRAALQLSGVAAADVVHVGDSWESDVQGAIAAGITPVWLDRSGAGGSTHRDGVARICGLRELPRCIEALPTRR